MLRSFVVLLFFLSIELSPQTTLGVVSMQEDASSGFVLFSPFTGTKTYLVDNCGNLVNEWDRGTRPGLSAELLESGNLFRTYKIDPIGPYTSASNAGGLEIVDWNNNLLWKYEINTPEQLSHHDAVIMPNGNILVLTWELTFSDELIELGRDPNEIAFEGFMWSEKILELEPIGTEDANIVWEWHINDHYVQDFDESKEGFGVISEHPELFDINQPDLDSGNSNETRDWNHFNSIDFNPALDQILISVRNSDEVWIIDHSTTTVESASHSGGTYGRGGDILYRWGNPSAYQGADLDQQMLWGQHGVHWVKEGLNGAGQILIFNNGNGKPGGQFSQIQLLDAPQSDPGFYVLEADSVFSPDAATTIYGDLEEENFAQILPTGNILINEGSSGRVFEINADREIVWDYIIPVNGDFPLPQGFEPDGNFNFRAYRYAPDFPGLDGIEIAAAEPIELEPLPCELPTSTGINNAANIALEFNYDAPSNSIRLESTLEPGARLSIFDLTGKAIIRKEVSDDRFNLGQTLSPGLYLFSIHSTEKGQSSKLIPVY